MEKTTKIRELLRTITGTDRPKFDFRLMEVVAIDGDLCQARMGDFVIPGIRLSSIGGGSENGLLITPTIGSVILVADISCGALRELNAVGYSEIDSIRFHKGSTTVRADAGAVDVTVGSSKIHIEDKRIQFNGDDNGGLVKIEELRQSLESLKTYCETMKTATSAGINAVGIGAAASGTTGAGAFDAAMAAAAIQIENMENKEVTH